MRAAYVCQSRYHWKYQFARTLHLKKACKKAFYASMYGNFEDFLVTLDFDIMYNMGGEL